MYIIIDANVTDMQHHINGRAYYTDNKKIYILI